MVRILEARPGFRLLGLTTAILMVSAVSPLGAADDKDRRDRPSPPAGRSAPPSDRGSRPPREDTVRPAQPERPARTMERRDNAPAMHRNEAPPDRSARPAPPHQRDGGYTPANRSNEPMRNANPPREMAPARNNPPPPSDMRRSGTYGSPNRPMERSAPPQGINRGPDGRVQTYRSPAGHEVRYGPGGNVSTIHAGGRTIYRGPSGSGRIIHERPDRVVIVTNRSGHGYVQRPFAYHGHEYINRTYYRRGTAYVRYYRPYTYRGVVFYSYAPVRYYPPAFYGWAYRPWGAPVYYRWGWTGSPWYGYYGGYFEPAPYYPSPTLWLVDYLIAERLAEAYDERAAAAQQQAYPYQGGSSLSPEVKQAIADEVQRQLALEGSQSQMAARNDAGEPGGDLPQILSDNRPHVFVVSYTLDVTDERGGTCSVTRGDVLRLSSPPPPDAAAAYVQVVASKGQDCRVGSTVVVSLQDLQDTNNQMRETVNAGLGELQTRSGQGGLPALPAAARAPAVPAPFADAAPPADAQVAQELTQEVQEADRVEQQVVQEAKSAESAPAQMEPAPGMLPAPLPPPVRIMKGQTANDVVAIMGNPSQIVDLGKKQIYVYPSVKITFSGGRVSEIQ